MNTICNTTKNEYLSKFIDFNGNNKISEMNKSELKEFIDLIGQYNIQLRSKLNLAQYITFGLELEFENAMVETIKEELKNSLLNKQWIIKNDNSLINGAEINSPIMKDEEVFWKELDKICSIVFPQATIGRNSGGHIHIGTQTLGEKKESWLNFIKLWSVYENIIFRFAYGEFSTARQSILEFAKPMAKTFWSDYEYLKMRNSDLESTMIRISHMNKYQAVSFITAQNYKVFANNNTIEFRCPNGTLNSTIWQNNVNLFVNLLLYSKSSSFNDDIIQKRYRSISNGQYSFESYDNIYLPQAIELCDMIFANNIDKIYFLKQYLKFFQVKEEKRILKKKY